MLNVKKRDGNIVPFDLKKIENAIEKAFVSVNCSYTHDVIELLALRVTASFSSKVVNNTIAVVVIVLITAAIVFVLDVVFDLINEKGINKFCSKFIIIKFIINFYNNFFIRNI